MARYTGIGTILSLAAGLAAGLAASGAQAAEPVAIAVFDFVLVDKSAGGGIIAPSAADAENLQKTSAEARLVLAQSGRYRLIEAGGAEAEIAAAGGILGCNGCEAGLAGKLGADQAMVGVLTRINRTEFTLQVVVRDARTGGTLVNAFTGLRMGANYAWPRGAKWLLKNRVPGAGNLP